MLSEKCYSKILYHLYSSTKKCRYRNYGFSCIEYNETKNKMSQLRS